MNDTHYNIKGGCGLALTPIVIGKDHGQMLIESAQHSYFGEKAKNKKCP